MADSQEEMTKKGTDDVSYVIIDKNNTPIDDHPPNRYAAQLLPGGTVQLVEWDGHSSNEVNVESGIEAVCTQWNEGEDAPNNETDHDTQQHMVSVEECTIERQQAALWTQSGTKLLLNLYEEKKPFLGTVYIKNKHMWHAITEEMKAKGYPYNESQVECKWKSLLRAFRNATDYNRKTIRGRRTCPFQKELENILSKEKTTEPTPIVIDTTRVMMMSENEVDISDDSFSERTESFQSKLASNTRRMESTLCSEIRLLREQMKRTYEDREAKRTKRELRKKERDREKQKRHDEIMDLLRQLKNSPQVSTKPSSLTTERRENAALKTEIKLLQQQIRKEHNEREAKRLKMELREEEREKERQKRHEKKMELLLQLRK